MDVDDFLDISDYYMSIQDMKSSEKAIERGLSMHRGDPLLNISKAGIAIFKGDYDTARKIAEEQAGCGEQDLLFINGQLALTEMPPNMQKAEDLFRQWLEIEESESKGNKDDMKDAYARVINSIYEISGSIKVTERWIEEYIEKILRLTATRTTWNLSTSARKPACTARLLLCIPRYSTQIHI